MLNQSKNTSRFGSSSVNICDNNTDDAVDAAFDVDLNDLMVLESSKHGS